MDDFECDYCEERFAIDDLNIGPYGQRLCPKCHAED